MEIFVLKSFCVWNFYVKKKNCLIFIVEALKLTIKVTIRNFINLHFNKCQLQWSQFHTNPPTSQQKFSNNSSWKQAIRSLIVHTCISQVSYTRVYLSVDHHVMVSRCGRQSRTVSFSSPLEQEHRYLCVCVCDSACSEEEKTRKN